MRIYAAIIAIATLFLCSQGVSLESYNNKVKLAELKVQGANKDPYGLIREKFGKRSIESPDLYEGNHRAVRHINVVGDNKLGYCFAFHIHLNEDRDRDKFIKFGDRQRNEIKVYHGSDRKLHGLQGTTFAYEWKFKVSSDMKVSKRFTHLFQIKAAKSDSDRFPLVTFTGSRWGKKDFFMVRYYGTKKHRILEKIPWKSITGKWLQATVTAKYSNNGFLEVKIRDLKGRILIHHREDQIDMWRGNSSGKAIIRPKFGIYRSILDKDKLNLSDTVYFNDFKIFRIMDK